MSTTKRWGVFTGFLGGAKSYTVTYETDSRSDWDVEVRAERFRRAALPGRFFNRATGRNQVATWNGVSASSGNADNLAADPTNGAIIRRTQPVEYGKLTQLFLLL